MADLLKRARESKPPLENWQFLEWAYKVRFRKGYIPLTLCGHSSHQVTCSGTLDDIYAMSTPPSTWHLANEFRILVIGLNPVFNLFILIANVSLSLPVLPLFLMTNPELGGEQISVNDFWKGTKVTHIINSKWSLDIKVFIYETKRGFNSEQLILKICLYSVTALIIHFWLSMLHFIFSDAKKERKIQKMAANTDRSVTLADICGTNALVKRWICCDGKWIST